MRGETETSARSQQSVEALDDNDAVGAKKISRKERRRLEKAEKKLQQQENGSDDEEEDMEEEADEEGSEEEESEDEGEDYNSDLDESDEEGTEEKEEFNIEDYNEKDVFDENMVAMMETASKEIPYIIQVHDSYESFSALVWDR